MLPTVLVQIPDMHAEMLIMKEPTPRNPLYLKRIVSQSKNKTTKNEKKQRKKTLGQDFNLQVPQYQPKHSTS